VSEPTRARGVRLTDRHWALVERIAGVNQRSLSWVLAALIQRQLEGRPGVPEDPDGESVHSVGTSAQTGKGRTE